MRKFLKYFFISVLFVFHLFLAAVVNYSMPSYDVTKVTGRPNRPPQNNKIPFAPDELLPARPLHLALQ